MPVAPICFSIITPINASITHTVSLTSWRWNHLSWTQRREIIKKTHLCYISLTQNFNRARLTVWKYIGKHTVLWHESTNGSMRTVLDMVLRITVGFLGFDKYSCSRQMFCIIWPVSLRGNSHNKPREGMSASLGPICYHRSVWQSSMPQWISNDFWSPPRLQDFLWECCRIKQIQTDAYKFWFH